MPSYRPRGPGWPGHGGSPGGGGRRGGRFIRRVRRRRMRRLRKLRRWLTPHNAVPSMKRVKMHFTNFWQFPATQITADEMYYYPQECMIHANSPYGPSVGAGGGGRLDHNASQYNFYSTLYNNYEVVWSKVRYTWSQTIANAGAVPMRIGVLLNGTVTPLMDSFEQLCSRLNVKYKTYQPEVNLKRKSVVIRFSKKKRFQSDFGSNIGTIGSRPTLSAYFIPFIQFESLVLGALPHHNLSVSVTYYVRWFNRKEIMDLPQAVALIQTTEPGP